MSIFSRYNPVPITLAPPHDKPNQRDSEGKLVTVNFPNQWGTRFTSFAASGYIGISSSSGIILNTPGFVETSGLIADSLYAQNIYKIDSSGEVLDLYPGAASGLIYKAGNDELAATTGIIYNEELDSLIFSGYGTQQLLYISDGGNEASPSNELATYSHIEFSNPVVVGEGEDAQQVGPQVNFNVELVHITGGIKVGPEIELYKGRVLTHMGSGDDITALWQPPDFLPEGLTFNRYPMRPVFVMDGAIAFYNKNPTWYEPLEDVAPFTDDTVLGIEFDIADTVALVNENGDVSFVKFSDNVRYLTYDDDIFVEEPQFDDITEVANWVDPIDGEPYSGTKINVCPPGAALPVSGISYAFSVKKGSYFEMALASGVKSQARFNCEVLFNEDADETDSRFTFKPSTINTLSNRPELYTSFNSVAEDIDFNIYGRRVIEYDNYVKELFDLNDNGVPSGLVPSFKIDAHIPNAVSGLPSTGVIYEKYIDREKTMPTGWGFDESAKVLVNTSGAYSYSAIASGVGTLESYANLTVSGVSYTDYLMSREIYLLPEPTEDGESEYVTNALLTVNDKGRIISRRATENPTEPGPPTNLSFSAGRSEISLGWNAPVNNGGKTITNYIVQFSANNGNEWTTLPQTPVLVERQSNDQTSATITGLSVLTPYIFRIAAQNSVGISEYTAATDTVFVSADLPENPNNFTGFRFFSDTPGGPSEINLSWEPGHNGGSAILGYLIEESEDGGINWVNYNSPENLITNQFETITGTNEDITYLYRLSAYNSIGQSSYSFLAMSSKAEVENPIEEDDPEDDPLGNWDFGLVLFTGGVC